ncbi:C4-dicarboxylate ABC transporter [Pelagivirga sediminicola]|uniref:C4-dicarboxylate ABC transporter n=2 Tax=Pelagivirga sediminicola TaxID=2170575 RepID=A0A2T7G691_9RHOB|nr:C4-dicarboxylate ABC transporter [Pelagivirga sediminicola]
MDARALRRGPVVSNLVAALTLVAIFFAVNQIFNFRLFVDVTILQNAYLYTLGAIFLSIVFLVYPLTAGSHRWSNVTDFAAAGAALLICGYFALTGKQSLNEGWEYAQPMLPKMLSFALWALIIEAMRRVTGMLMAVIALAFSLYPVFAGSMPGPIAGFSQPIGDIIPFHILSSESSFGIPMEAFGTLVLGFVLFGAALQFTGGGAFFNDLAFRMVGKYRGGAAKVATVGSGLMGSMSGSVISNIMTTGAVSIPAMKRTGFSANYAAGVEACASTGGVMMPPIMGAVAFVMASFLGVGYAEIVLAAIIPSALFYFGLIIQIDSYAARRGLTGLNKSELPVLLDTLRNGWHYIIVFAVLIWMLIGLEQERIAPFICTFLLLVVTQLFPSTRLSLSKIRDLLSYTGTALAEMAAILLGVGFIVGAFSATGLSGTLANDLVFLAGDGVLALLIMGALTSFIFGMGMTVTSCYILLAVVLAPALVQAGLHPIAAHLFIMYWGMVSYITPPVALGAFAAATLAGTSPIRAGFTAMRLGSIIYVLPFLFVLEPALIGVGEWSEVIPVMALAFIGVWLIASGTQGYLAVFGPLGHGKLGIAVQICIIAGGVAIAIPATLVPVFGHIGMTVLGLILVAIGLGLCSVTMRRQP